MTEKLTFQNAFDARTDLHKYKNNALLLFALQLKFQIEDIDTVAANSLTDSNDDKKCDLVYVDRDNGFAVIAQGYIAQDETRQEAPANKASDLNTAASWLLTRPIEDLPTKLKPAALELRDALEAKEIRSLQFWYSHNLPGSENVKNELRTVENTAKGAIVSRFPDSEVSEISAIEVGRETLSEWYQSLTIPILVSEETEVFVPGGYDLREQDWEAFVTAVPGKWLYGLFQNHKSDLFSANVRGYLGSRNVEQNINNGIKKTAGENPSHFWVYNNGFTALVNDFEYDLNTKKLTIKGISIVNGAQTTGAIGSLKSEPDDTAMVSARFVKCQNTETIKNIIRFNNSQNRVEAPDFRSNDPIQKRLISEFRHIPATTYSGGRRGGHEDIIRRPQNLLPSDTAAQTLAAFHQDPVVAYNEKSRIWLSDSLYARYFSERTTAKHIVFAYSLLRTIETKKRELVNAENEERITEVQRRQLEFLRYRGATFLLTTAISSCLETFLERPIPDRFRVSFNTDVSPDEAQIRWRPIVEATIPFADRLSMAVEKGLKNRELVSQVIRDFGSLVEATKTANSSIFEEFSQSVLVE